MGSCSYAAIGSLAGAEVLPWRAWRTRPPTYARHIMITRWGADMDLTMMTVSVDTYGQEGRLFGGRLRCACGWSMSESGVTAWTLADVVRLASEHPHPLRSLNDQVDGQEKHLVDHDSVAESSRHRVAPFFSGARGARTPAPCFSLPPDDPDRFSRDDHTPQSSPPVMPDSSKPLPTVTCTGGCDCDPYPNPTCDGTASDPRDVRPGY